MDLFFQAADDPRGFLCNVLDKIPAADRFWIRRQPQTRVRRLIMKSTASQTKQSCGCFKRRTVISSLALTVTATILSPFRKLLAQTPTPQEKESTETKVMGMGSHLLQGKHPIDQIDAYVCGLHFYNGDMNRQVIAHHFCSHRSEEFLQCVIYDTNKSDARLIGIEYIISARLFGGLSDEEKRYWHSHQFEVRTVDRTGHPGACRARNNEKAG
jgi:Protein of unknown function (DUF1264)